MINKGKKPLYQVSTQLFKNSTIAFVKCLTIFKKRLVSLHLTFAKICKLHGYEKYKLNDNVIIFPNIDETQFILLRLPRGNSPIVIFLNHQLKYKSPYIYI
jgi:hypothetical protein